MSYALIQLQPLKIVELFGSIPEPLVWPNGDASHAVSPGDVRCGHMFANVIYTPSAPNEFYQMDDSSMTVNGTVLTVTRNWKPVDLEQAKSVLLGRMDDAARDSGLVTPWAGQAMIYYEKYSEAVSFQSDPSEDKYPMLSAMLGFDGDDLKSVAATILKAHEEWLLASCEFERKRRGGKYSIRESTTVDEAVATFKAWSAK